MPAAITEFIDVDVLLSGAAAEKFAFGIPLGAFTHTITVNRQDGPYFSLSEVVAAGFTSVATPDIYGWASAVFAQDDGVDSLLIGRIDALDASLTASLDAIEAAGANTWYITNIESRADADIADLAAWTETRNKLAIVQSDDLTLTAALALQTAGYNRTALIYHDDDTEYLDGAWTSSGGGMNLDAPGGVGIWAYRQLEAVPFDDVTAAEATSIYAADANLFGRNKGLSFTSKGTAASSRFLDVQTSIDWVKARTEEEILSLFVGTPTKVPYTNAGINLVAAAIQNVLNRGVNFGHFSPDVAPTVTAPDVSTISSADKINRELTLQATAVLAGAIQKVNLTINLTF
jgi:hypothetical protein